MVKCYNLETLVLNDPCIIVGCGSHSHAVISIIESSGIYSIAGLIDMSDSFNKAEVKSGYSVLNSFTGLKNSWEYYSNYNFVLALGKNVKRLAVFNDLVKLDAKLPNIIAGSAFVDPNVNLGNANVISHSAIINSMTVIGDNNIINTGSIIEHDVCIGNGNHIAPRSVLLGSVRVGDMCLVGAGSVINESVSIHDNITVGASSLVLKNITDSGVTVFGLPAKVRIR